LGLGLGLGINRLNSATKDEQCTSTSYKVMIRV
jgi:hypothetical protein